MLWNVPNVNAEPEIILDFWQICKSNENTYHFAGYHGGAGRCSSPIMQFDLLELAGVTRSGRKYRLYKDGRGFNMNAAACAGDWFRLNKLTYEVVNPEEVKFN